MREVVLSGARQWFPRDQTVRPKNIVEDFPWNEWDPVYKNVSLWLLALTSHRVDVHSFCKLDPTSDTKNVEDFPWNEWDPVYKNVSLLLLALTSHRVDVHSFIAWMLLKSEQLCFWFYTCCEPTVSPQHGPIRKEHETTWPEVGPIRLQWAEPTCGPTVWACEPTVSLWAHGESTMWACEPTVGKWNEMDKQMLKHSYKPTDYKANGHINIGNH